MRCDNRNKVISVGEIEYFEDDEGEWTTTSESKQITFSAGSNK